MPDQTKSTHTSSYGLPENTGPIVVVNKGHSGSRFIAQALETAGVFMGADMNAAFDSMSWHEDFAVPLMNSEWFPEWPVDDSTFTSFLEDRFSASVRRYTGGDTVTGPWGWKGSTLFVSPLILQAFPNTRMLHIIRDGRDVALSGDGRLNLPLFYPGGRRNPVKRARQLIEGFRDRQSRDDYRKKIFFGSGDIDEWNGITLDRRSIAANRTLLQMQSWVRNVSVAREFGATIGDRYMEIRYEELCEQPRAVMTDVLEWAGLPVSEHALSFVEGAARTGSINKWHSLDLEPDRRADFDRACEHGSEMLAALGYQVD